MSDDDLIKLLRDALQNMVGAFDTPVAWRKIPDDGIGGFIGECRKSARDALWIYDEEMKRRKHV